MPAQENIHLIRARFNRDALPSADERRSTTDGVQTIFQHLEARGLTEVIRRVRAVRGENGVIVFNVVLPKGFGATDTDRLISNMSLPRANATREKAPLSAALMATFDLDRSLALGRLLGTKRWKVVAVAEGSRLASEGARGLYGGSFQPLASFTLR